ncbi:adenylate guanylate cyclase : Probable adenylate cyclase OS=Planctomyces maris DSM 8797 GN=PM8797T_31900 PE=4 SV=1: Guanylate_cyc [Gemmataceae bacterium]|nr:adenylate guanylate cyclase : Probable adenylate cyclase OS=Planctomyces maris DSM 8797 GN=PM8797T_31900 PE=4 SV=1: Guanylate_cyc [Gemmataceae bacterium]VTT98257.1 adenylate guanylate cyclase : Probable adenylate cyclase OS=Planctomyces maris DSM 8797 GN=PM8797T_31900 PE=4 SV=1: Guanylate_cyc [Gemmataceae bacterium]
MILIAQGSNSTESWRRPLPSAGTVVIGREAGAWAVPWEPFLGRRHVELALDGERLKGRRVAAAANPVFRAGKPVETFELESGEAFVIGRTVFTLANPSTRTFSPSGSGYGEKVLVESRTVMHHELDGMAFRDAPHRLDVLSKLPDVISSATDDTDLFARLTDMLLAGVRRADAVAIVTARAGGATGDPPVPASAATVKVLHWDRRFVAEGAFEPSRRLIVEACDRQKQTVLHVWSRQEGPATGAEPFTMRGGIDWAFCTPVHGDGCPGWGIYVAGGFDGADAQTLLAPWDANELRDDLKFAELVADILGALRQVHVFRERQGVFRRFFSPGVMSLLSGHEGPRALEPRETDITVLFCDLRGFSKTVEVADDLLAVLNRVSTALGVMTQNILQYRGAIADFLGDAALGFWGWPLSHPGKAEDACRAALGIRAAFEGIARDPKHPLSGFRVGIGIASGRAVAGGIGPPEQVKITVFGPVVNLASRLQDMTKLLRVPILIDGATAAAVRSHTSPDVARVRRLAKVKPYGLETPIEVAELIPPAGPEQVLTNDDVAAYEAALDAFLSEDWNEAYKLLHQVPPDDRGKDMLTEFILKYNRTPPTNWNGVIPLGSKG